MAAARLYQRKWLLIKLPIALAALGVMSVLWTQLMPMPPGRVTLSSGLPEGVYHAYALRYRQFFEDNGIELALAPSEGTIQNLERLAGRESPVAQLGFVQGGAGRGFNAPGTRLLTIARVDNEPLWIFSRVAGLESPQQMQGLRVSLGPAGSGTRKLALALLEQVRMTPKDLVDSQLSGPAAVQAMAQGALDVVVMVSAPDSPVVKSLMELPGVQLVQLRRASAVVERMPYLEPRLLPQGAMGSSGKLQVPPRDTAVLVASASLLARADLHPALQRLAARAALEVHAGNGLFRRSGEFPTLKRVEFPASTQARQTLAHGLPWLESVLPFWWSQLVLRLLVICLPVTLVALWFARVLPAYLRWLVESRIASWYGELKYIEHDLSQAGATGLDRARYREQLDDMERRMRAVVTPAYLMPRWFLLRHHVDFVRASLQDQRGR